VEPNARRRHAVAWAALAGALAVHVADEAAHDFLSVYNPAVLAIRERLPWLPLPVFSFDVWLAGLIAAVILLLLLTRSVAQGRRWTVPASYVFGGFMLLNGLGHFAGSIALARAMPGVYSSPLLIACSLYLLRAVGQAAGPPPD
jgi:hypothetical protein